MMHVGAIALGLLILALLLIIALVVTRWPGPVFVVVALLLIGYFLGSLVLGLEWTKVY